MTLNSNNSSLRSILAWTVKQKKQVTAESYSVDKAGQEFVMLYVIGDKARRHFPEALSLCIFLNHRYSSKYFVQIYRAQYGASAMVVYLRGTPTLMGAEK